MLNWTPAAYGFSRHGIGWQKLIFALRFRRFRDILVEAGGSIKHPAAYIYIYICMPAGLREGSSSSNGEMGGTLRRAVGTRPTSGGSRFFMQLQLDFSEIILSNVFSGGRDNRPRQMALSQIPKVMLGPFLLQNTGIPNINFSNVNCSATPHLEFLKVNTQKFYDVSFSVPAYAEQESSTRWW